MTKRRQARYSLILLALCLLLVACGSEPAPTAAPTSTPEPTGTSRPTFTATAVAQATREATPTEEAQAESTATARPEATRTTRPSPTPPEMTPTPAATRASGPAPRLTGFLIFPVFEPNDQTYHVLGMDLGTGQLSRVMDEASQPTVSLANGRIAWRSWKHDQRGLLSRPLEGSDVWQMIPFNEAARPDWASDGERFVFHSRQEPDRESRLYLFTGVSGEPFMEIQRHGSPIIGRTPAFMPDGRIIYQGCVENDCGLYIMDANGDNPQQITGHKDDTTPAVSPDGTRIAYMSLQSGYWQVNVVNADGTGQRRLTDDWYWNGLPVWSPDGEQLIFVSTRDENWPDTFQLSENSLFRLWVMDADGQNQRPLSDFAFRMDGVPARTPEHEVAGWIEERLVWLPPQIPTN